MNSKFIQIILVFSFLFNIYKPDISTSDETSKDKVEYCKSIFQNHCPLSDSIMHGIPIELEINE